MIDRKHFIPAFSILFLFAVSVHLLTLRGQPVVLHANLDKIPMTIAGFQGQDDSFQQEIYDILDTDQSVYRHYIGPEGQKISLYIGYYGTAKGGRTGHNPRACLPGAGWGIVKSESIILHPSYSPGGVKLNYVIARNGMSYEVMLHWYQSDGNKVLATGFSQNLQRFFNRLLHNRNDGAYVQVSAITDETGIEGTSAVLQKFTLNILEFLPSYWPVEG